GKSEGGQRIYHDKDIAVLKLIRSLLYEERFTISGARRELARRLDGAEPLPAPAPATDDPSVLGNVRRELNAILEMLR
ncbi:MerR family transcriptional regulator, partial [bacterium]|nr:MerR family transcriptional regulator [candidate division CSSED10-310 bacterium]